MGGRCVEVCVGLFIGDFLGLRRSLFHWLTVAMVLLLKHLNLASEFIDLGFEQVFRAVGVTFAQLIPTVFLEARLEGFFGGIGQLFVVAGRIPACFLLLRLNIRILRLFLACLSVLTCQQWGTRSHRLLVSVLNFVLLCDLKSWFACVFLLAKQTSCAYGNWFMFVRRQDFVWAD